MAASYIGIDLHRTVIQVCMLDARGEQVAEERIRYETLEEGLRAVAFIGRFAPDCLTAVEALGLNRWFVNARREAEFELARIADQDVWCPRSTSPPTTPTTDA